MKKFFSICILIIIILQELMIVSMANSLNLASTKYLILEEKLLITRIQPETPLEEFVNNFNIQSSNIHIYEDETFSNEVTEGYIKTGMYLTHDGANIKYELSVIGDIKQDGEMNQIDLNLLIKHVVGNKENQLDGIQKTSADINGDEKVNQIDITTLIRYIVTHELYIPEIKRPSSPDITITKGEKENEEWYKSDVELKISQNKNSDVEIGKTIYKIDSEEEKTVEGKEANITITKEGESKITAYAYSTQGARSETTSKTVKIDKQAPSAQIVLETTSNTMKVEVSAQDNLSGVKEYIYYLGTKNGDNVQWQQGINSKENNYTYTKLDASKEYYVKVEVFDNAGNKAIVEKSKETVSIPELYDDEKAKENDVTANITVKKEPTNWTNSNVIVKLQISEEISKYKLEYKKNTEEAWQKYNSETGIIAEENCEITVRLTDDKSSGKGISIKITNIDKEKAQVKVSNVGVTSKSFTQKIEVTDNASGLSKIALYYRKVGETQYKVKEENYQTINGSEAGELTTSKTITIDNLTNGSYEIYTEVTDVAGNVTTVKGFEGQGGPEGDDGKGNEGEPGASKPIEEITSAESTVTLTPDNTNWTNGSVKVTATTSNNAYQIQTSTDANNWSTNTTITMNENGTIYARLYDGINGGKSTSLDVINIDTQKAQVKVSNVGVTSKSFTQKIEVTDNASGLSKIALYYRKVGETQYKVKEENYQTINGSEAGELTTSKTITIDNLTNGSYEIYTEVTDVAGNVTTVKGFEGQGGPAGDDGKGNEGEPGASKPLDKITSAESTVTLTPDNTNWTNGSVKVTATTSNNAYQIQTSTDASNWSTNTTITMNENGTIYARLYDGLNGGKSTSLDVTNIDTQKAQVKVSNVGVTSKSFTQKIEVTDNASGLSKIALYYRKVGETQYKVKEENYQTINGSVAGELTTSKTITIDNLTNGSYEIYTEVTDVAGNVTTVKGFEGQGGPAGDDGKGNEGEPGASKPIEEITSAEGTVTLTPDNTNWTNGSVKVTATTSNSTYQIQTSIDASNWSTNTTITMNENGTIYARLYDGINSGDVISLTIGNIDKQNPSSSISASNTYSITSGTTTSISATVTHTDNESGVNIGNCKYVFNTSATKLGNVTSNYTGGTFSSNGQTISKTVSAGTYYLHVLTVDNAGNAIETIYGPITVTQKVTGISLNKTSAELEIDETLQLTATVTPSAAGNKELTWSSSNTSVATVDQNGLVIAVAEGSATITATAKDGSGKSANCSVTVNNPNISTTESYVKYYADVNNDGYPEGVIFADMVADGGKTGIWNLYGDSILSSCGTYTISTVSSSSAKSYKIVKEKYNGKFGTAPVIQACSESGEDRFYVMNLYELLATKYNWYYSAYEEKISDYSTVTSEDFGTGKKNTETMIEKWNNQVYGSQNGNTSYKDIWGNIEKEFNNEDSWFLPSRAELAAFGDTFNVNSYNYKNTYGLSDCYFTSSLKDNERIWVAFCSGGAIGVANVNNEHRVRLCATF